MVACFGRHHVFLTVEINAKIQIKVLLRLSLFQHSKTNDRIKVARTEQTNAPVYELLIIRELAGCA